MDEFKFYVASEKIYHYFWHTFCDKIIEVGKKKLASEKTRKSAQFMLLEILFGSLKLLHPFMPFITEEIYQQLPHPKGPRKEIIPISIIDQKSIEVVKKILNNLILEKEI